MRSFALALATFALGLTCDRPPASKPAATTPSADATPASAPSADEPTASTHPAANEAPPTKPEPVTRTGTIADVEYFEVVIGGAKIDDRLPMVVAIHGLGDQPQHFAGLLADLDTPVRLVFPRALDPYEGGGYSWFPLRARTPDVDKLAEGMTRATHALAGAVRQLVAERPTKGRPVLTGFSQGGMLTFALATSHPSLFSAAFPVGGWLPPPLWPIATDDPRDYPPIVALHGDTDKAVALGPTQAAVTELARLGFRAELHVYPDVGHAIPPGMRQELHELIRRELAQQ